MPESNGDVASMIEAEVNEGGPPSPVPCDTPADIMESPNAHAAVHEAQATVEVCPAPDRIVHLPLGMDIRGARSTPLLKSAGLELIRLVLPAGTQIPPHRAAGEITVQCLEGHVTFCHDGREIELRPGDLVHLCPKELHSLKGIADSSVLVTLCRPRADEIPEIFPPP